MNRGYFSLVRCLGAVVLLSMPSACAFCVRYEVHPAAVENATFCSQYIGKGDFVSAEARCKIAIEYSPRYAEAYNLLGLIEFNRGFTDRAADLFKKAISLKTDFAEAYNNLGAVLLERKQREQACDQFREAIEIDPGYVAARANLGDCFFYSAKFGLARDEYQKCVELDPNSCGCRLGLGSTAIKEERLDEAQTHFKKMTEICAQNPDGFYNLCWTLFRMHRCVDAVEACLGALALNRDYQEARGMLTQAQECVAFDDQAIVDYQQRIRRNPGDAELHFNLGVISYDRRAVDFALNEFLNTIKLNPKHALAHYWAARIYDDQLNADETIKMCRRFVDLLRGDEYLKEKEWCISRVKELQYQ